MHVNKYLFIYVPVPSYYLILKADLSNRAINEIIKVFPIPLLLLSFSKVS